uniref:Uncharacterized protein n=1 Tax=Arundo donax TaxID=35708 RepID=A0A0A9FQF4_ARUDO
MAIHYGQQNCSGHAQLRLVCFAMNTQPYSVHTEESVLLAMRPVPGACDPSANKLDKNGGVLMCNPQRLSASGSDVPHELP